MPTHLCLFVCVQSRDDASSKYDAEKKRRMEAERTNETLMRQLEALRAQQAGSGATAAAATAAEVPSVQLDSAAASDAADGDADDAPPAALSGVCVHVCTADVCAC